MTMPVAAHRTIGTSQFETTDLNLAAYLRCLHYRLLDVLRGAGGRCTFIFTDRPSRQSDVGGYFDESGMVSALTYAEALRLLKARIYQR
jgi:hypothetical protein